MTVFCYLKTIVWKYFCSVYQEPSGFEKENCFCTVFFLISSLWLLKISLKTNHILFFKKFYMMSLFFFVWGLSTTWAHACLIIPSCYFLTSLLVKKTYSLVSISLSIKNNVFGLTSKLFCCLTKCLISAEALHNSYYIAVPVTLLILTVSNYAQFILFDFLVVNCYVFSKPSFWKLTHSGETLVTRWLY